MIRKRKELFLIAQEIENLLESGCANPDDFGAVVNYVQKLHTLSDEVLNMDYESALANKMD